MSGPNAKGWLPTSRPASQRLRSLNDLPPRQALVFLVTVSLKASELKHWLTEQKSVAWKHMAEIGLSP